MPPLAGSRVRAVRGAPAAEDVEHAVVEPHREVQLQHRVARLDLLRQAGRQVQVAQRPVHRQGQPSLKLGSAATGRVSKLLILAQGYCRPSRERRLGCRVDPRDAPAGARSGPPAANGAERRPLPIYRHLRYSYSALSGWVNSRPGFWLTSRPARAVHLGAAEVSRLDGWAPPIAD